MFKESRLEMVNWDMVLSAVVVDDEEFFEMLEHMVWAVVWCAQGWGVMITAHPYVRSAWQIFVHKRRRGARLLWWEGQARDAGMQLHYKGLMDASPYGKEERKNLPEGKGEHCRACAQQRTESQVWLPSKYQTEPVARWRTNSCLMPRLSLAGSFWADGETVPPCHWPEGDRQ